MQTGFYNWVSHARDLWLRYGIQQADTRSTKVIRHFESEVLHRLKTRITEDRQLHLFTSFKTIYKFEPYLDYIQGNKGGFTITLHKDHKLPVSKENYHKKKLLHMESPKVQYWVLCCF